MILKTMGPDAAVSDVLAELELAQHAHNAAHTHSPFAPATGPTWGPL